MTTPTDTASTARRQADLHTLGTVAEQVGEFELAIARMANDPAMDVGQAPELLGKALGLGSATEKLYEFLPGGVANPSGKSDIGRDQQRGIARR